MLKEPFAKIPYHFPGITVLVPKQCENDIVAIEKGSLVPNNIPIRTKNFTLIRYIANIVLLTKTDYDMGKMNPVKTFDPPIEIRVGYNFDDIMKSNCEIKNLKLAYWDGDQWVIISNPSHGYHILPPSTGKVAEARIWSWVGDPPLAWGK
jgi:hypothetical protein